MDMKKTAKKIAALVAGTTMLGATIMGATALDLSNYPAPFVTNGVFSGKIVVGAKAATSDVVGAIDLAASLQASAKSSSEVTVPGAAGEATVSGDNAEFRTGSDVVSLEEPIGTVKQTFIAADLEALKSGVLDTGTSTTPVKQYLKFGNTAWMVKYAEDTDSDKVSDYLYTDTDQELFEYYLEFTEGAESEVSSAGALDDLEDEVLTILGAPFTVVDATKTGAQLSLTLLGGQVADVLRDGETKTYTIDGQDYEVTAVFISDSGSGSAKLSVNGVMTKELTEGKTQVLGSDVTVGVQSILTNQREGLVEFYLGANKIKLTDTNYSDTAYAANNVEVRGETVDNAELVMKATDTGSNLKLNYIKYHVNSDDEYFVAPGEGAKVIAEEDNEGAFLTDTWDIKYAGLVKTGSSVIKVDSVSDHSYRLDFTNVNGDEFTVPWITNKNTEKWGDDDDDFVFTEFKWAASNTSTTTISDNDYFIVSDKVSGDDKAATKVFRYQSLNEGDSTVTFKDLSGSDVVVSFTGTLGSASGDLIVDGVSHVFYIGSDEELSMDLDGNGSIFNGAEVWAVTEGGAMFDFGAQTFTALGVLDAPADPQTVHLYTDDARFDESGGNNEDSNFSIDLSSAGEVHLTAASFDLGGSSENLVPDPDNDEYERGYSGYGAFWELYNPSGTTDSEELTIDYPSTQRYAQVFVTAGVVDVMEGQMGESGKLMTEQVNPIAVGLAVLDTEAPAVGSAKMIVVGGPCVNTVAAELLGNPADCAEGFTPGKAVIKLWSDKNALLVAGYSAQDTLGASYVLADAKDYKLSGTEVEVVVADLNTITVNKVN